MSTDRRETDSDGDDLERDDELVPIGLLLRELNLEQRERRVRGIEAIDVQIVERKRAAFVEVVLRKKTRVTFAIDDGGNDLRPLWHVLAQSWVYAAHAFARVWNSERREWRSIPTRRCPNGCRFCPGAKR